MRLDEELQSIEHKSIGQRQHRTKRGDLKEHSGILRPDSRPREDHVDRNMTGVLVFFCPVGDNDGNEIERLST